MLVKLTPKQEKFCQCIVSGMDGTTAYKTAYDAAKSSDKVCNNESRVLLMRDDITERIAELRKPLINHAQNTAISERNKQIEYIRARIAVCEKKEDEQSLIRWNDQLNKILNLYRDNDTEPKQESTVNNLDTATLVKLSGTA